jgi:hypothetical protein
LRKRLLVGDHDDGVFGAVVVRHVGVGLPTVLPLLAVDQIPIPVGVTEFKWHRRVPRAVRIAFEQDVVRRPVVEFTAQCDFFGVDCCR